MRLNYTFQSFQQLLATGHGGSTDSEGSHLSAAVLEHTVAAIEKFITRKRRKKPTSPNSAPLEVVQEHPVLVSTLLLLLHCSPELVTARYSYVGVVCLCILCVGACIVGSV